MTTKQASVRLSSTLYGNIDGKSVYTTTLRNDEVSISITNLGCIITAIHTPDKQGISKNIVAGFRDLNAYRQNDHYLGCIVGRYANRIAGGRFTIGATTYQLPVNNGVNHLHGGVEGFHKKIWTITSLIQKDHEAGIVLEYMSRDGEEGYPGNLRVKVKYLLHANNQFFIEYEAVTDKQTPVNLTNHSYFNLTGFDNPVITDHILQINAGQYTERNHLNVPTGKLVVVKDTPLDFSIPKRIGEHIDTLAADQGYDHNYVLPKHAPGEIVLAAELHEPLTGRLLRILTDQPGIQLYTANAWNGITGGEQGLPYVKHGAVALETQAFPDSPNHAAFPNTILSPGDTYHTTTIFELGNHLTAETLRRKE